MVQTWVYQTHVGGTGIGQEPIRVIGCGEPGLQDRSTIYVGAFDLVGGREARGGDESSLY